jgi:hypothetical protein
MEKAKFNRENHPEPEAIAMMEEHEIDLMPDEDEDPIGMDLAGDEEITGIEAYQASVAIRQVAIEERRPLPPLEEHPDGHKDPERLASLHKDLEQIRAIKRAARSHEYFTAVYSTGEYIQTRVMTRSISGEGLSSFGASPAELAHVKLIMNVGGTVDNTMYVSERILMEELRKVVSNHFMGRCSVQPHEFPVKDGTEVIPIPSFLPLLSQDVSANTVVRYLTYRGRKRPIEMSLDTPDDMSEMVASGYMDRPTKLRVLKHPIRTDGEIEMITSTDRA